MKLLYFEIYGRMAHFRKFYTNVTSLSYFFPPRNTIEGLIAAIMGLEKDSYYELFSRENLGITVKVLSEPRKLLLSVDYIDVQDLSERSLRGRSGMKPTHIEFVVPVEKHEIGYGVFLGAKDQEMEKILMQIESSIANSRYCYPLSLGPAFCLATIRKDSVTTIDNAEVILSEGTQSIPVGTVVPTDMVTGFGLAEAEGKKIMVEERLPPDFGKNRHITGSGRNFMFEAGGKPIDLRVKGEVFRMSKVGDDVYGVFM